MKLLLRSPGVETFRTLREVDKKAGDWEAVRAKALKALEREGKIGALIEIALEEVARRIGEQRMKKYVDDFEYGNQDISGGLSSPALYECFWINSSIRISADEQVEFLKKLYLGKLPVSQRSQQTVREILILEKTPKYTLSAKTGGG
jgi:beta-lactamase class D